MPTLELSDQNLEPFVGKLIASLGVGVKSVDSVLGGIPRRGDLYNLQRGLWRRLSLRPTVDLVVEELNAGTTIGAVSNGHRENL